MKPQKLTCVAILGALVLGAAPSTAFAETNGAEQIKSNGKIEYEKNTGGVTPIDPEKPTEEIVITPGEGENNFTKDGELRLDVVSHLKFGRHKITTVATDYYAEPTKIIRKIANQPDEVRTRGNYVQLTDQRSDGAPEGWTLKASVTKAFTNGNNEVLKGAEITYINPFVSSTQDNTNFPTTVPTVKLETTAEEGKPVNTALFASADAGKGWGTYTIEYGRPDTDGQGNVIGTGENKTNATMAKSVMLSVPANTALTTKSAYQAEVTWVIAQLPTQEPSES